MKRLAKLRKAIDNSNFETVRALSKAGDSDFKSKALMWAAKCGNLEMVNVLLPLCGPDVSQVDALYEAASEGYLEIIKALLPTVNPMEDNSVALKGALDYGHLEVAKLLIPSCHSIEDNSHALAIAAGNGDLDMVKLLIPISDPKFDSSRALQVTLMREFWACAQILIPVSEVDKVATRLIGIRRLEALDFLTPHLSPLIFEMVERIAREEGDNQRMPNTFAILMEKRLKEKIQSPSYFPYQKARV